MLSTSVIEQAFSLLLIDSTCNAQGWEWSVSRRLVSVLAKRGVVFADEEVIAITEANELENHLLSLETATCVVLLSRGDNQGVWDWLQAKIDSPKIAVVCHWGEATPDLTDAVLKAVGGWAPIAVAPESAIEPREGALFLLKFLTEMYLHSNGRMTGRMVWFAWRKANELLKRRRMGAIFGLRT